MRMNNAWAVVILMVVMSGLYACGGGGGGSDPTPTNNPSWVSVFSDDFNRADNMLNDGVKYKVETVSANKNLFITSMKITGGSSGDGNTSFAQLIQTFNGYSKVRIRAIVNFVASDTHVGFYITGATTYFNGIFEPLALTINKGNFSSAPNTLSIKNANLATTDNYMIELISTAGSGIQLTVYDVTGSTVLYTTSINDPGVDHTNIVISMGDSNVTAPYATLDNFTIEKQ